MERALPALRDYLDQIGFVPLYKFIATARAYHTDPDVVSWWTLDRVADLEAYVRGDRAGLGLATCLMVKFPVPHRALTPLEQRVAGRLVDAELLTEAAGILELGPYQLVSAQDQPLLIDAGINYPGATRREVYFGRDSLQLLFYADTGRLARADRVIDLGTGSGAIGLSLARYSDHVTLTDVSPQALRLAHVNRLLHGRAGTVAIREERCEETLARGERYHVVTFNPPFLAVPEGLGAPVFARGLGPDGLGYCRMLLEELDRILAPGGTAYVVANLLGAAGGPFFAEELRRHAEERGLRIDVFVDATHQLTAGAPIFEALGAFLHGENPAVSREECQRRLEALYLRTFGATCSYLSVVVIRGARDTRPSVRVLHRRAEPGA